MNVSRSLNRIKCAFYEEKCLYALKKMAYTTNFRISFRGFHSCQKLHGWTTYQESDFRSISIVSLKNLHHCHKSMCYSSNHSVHKSTHFVEHPINDSRVKNENKLLNQSFDLDENDSSKKASKDYKVILQEYLLKHQCLPNGKERTMLMKLIPMDRRSFNMLLLRVWDSLQKGIISKEVRDTIAKWLKENEYRSPSIEESKKLASELCISVRQLQSQMYYIRDKASVVEGVISDHAKDTLNMWVDQHSRSPNSTEVKLLQEKTGISKSQLHQYITYRLESMKLKDVDIWKGNQKIRLWLMSNDFRTPTKEERDQLQQTTGYPRKYLNKRINYFLKVYEQTRVND